MRLLQDAQSGSASAETEEFHQTKLDQEYSMKRFSIAICAITLSLSGFAFSATHPVASKVKKAQLFDITNNELVASTRVEDSVFTYTADEITCDENGDEETPCVAKADHWTSICFKGDIEKVCSEMKKLFRSSDAQLMNDGAEESIQLKSCSSESGITVLSYDLISGHGGPNVSVQDKMIAMCPIFF
jgi:hypothetical protein